MKIGYARVSTKDQNLDLQILALRSAGCTKIFREKRSGRALSRPRLEDALASLRKGDALVFWHIDRLGRTARDLINLAYDLKERGIALRSLTQNLDTTTPDGAYNFVMDCANAERERARISMRTKAGLHATRLKGTKLGRPRCLNEKQVERARQLSTDRAVPVSLLARRFKTSEATIRRALRQ